MATLELYIHYSDVEDLDWLRNKAETALVNMIDENTEEGRFIDKVEFDGWDTVEDS